jgi:hypothetical protein
MNEDILEEIAAAVVNYLFGAAIIGILLWILSTVA